MPIFLFRQTLNRERFLTRATKPFLTSRTSSSTFIHPARASWHTDSNGNAVSGLLSMLNLTYVREHGYVNVRCSLNPGCPDEVQPYRAAEEGQEGKETHQHVFQAIWPMWFGRQAPEVIGSACCAQFVVSREQIRQRESKEYETMRRWIMDSELTDDITGWVFEYSWHVVSL